MAIHYYDEFPSRFSSRNFGDDLNPFLLGQLFSSSVLASKEVCILGVGSILNRRNAELVGSYRNKVVFSSGAGYGEFATDLDDSWEFACVRGPHTAKAMGLAESSGICDGAVLLSDYYKPKPVRQRRGIVFIPHIKTHFATGRVLADISSELGWRYLTPDKAMEDFIDGVRSASLVVTEAMHGAILADTMRVPWIPIAMHQHNEFKWRDWLSSIEQPYTCSFIKPSLWNPSGKSIKSGLKKPYQCWKMKQVKRNLLSLQSKMEILSKDDVLERHKLRLKEKVAFINQKYS